MTKNIRSFIISTHQVGESSYHSKKQQVWCESGTIPPEWKQVKEDESIDQAQIYTNAQSHRREGTRRILDRKGS
jgi:hypothetical protein